MKFDDIKEEDYLICTSTIGFTGVGDIVKVMFVYTGHAFSIKKLDESVIYTRTRDTADRYEPVSSLLRELI